MSARHHLSRSALVAALLLTVAAVPASGAVTHPPTPTAPPAGSASAVGSAPPVGTATSPVGAIPAPICSVPGDAGVLALVPPPAPDGGGTDTGPADPAVGANRTAVVDRIEGDTAVLLVEARGEVVARRLVRRRALPRAARHDDAVVTVTVVNDSVAAITYRPVETARRKRRAERRFELLAEPAPDGDGPALC